MIARLLALSLAAALVGCADGADVDEGCAEVVPPDAGPAVEGCGPGLEVVARTDLAWLVSDAVEVSGRVYVAHGTGVSVLDPRTGGTPREVWPTPGESQALAPADGWLWVADGTGGIARLGLPGGPAPGRLDRWRTGGEVVDIVAGGGRVWAANLDGRVLSLGSGATPAEAPLELATAGWPRSIAAWEGGAIVATGSFGARPVRVDRGGRLESPPPRCEPAPLRLVPTAAATGHMIDREQNARVRVFGGGIWLPEPGVGLERFTLDGERSSLLWMLPGAWDVVPWGDRLAVARGTAGVALVDWDAPSGPKVEVECDLPGDVRHLLVDGDRLLVVSSGTLFELVRKAPPSAR